MNDIELALLRSLSIKPIQSLSPSLHAVVATLQAGGYIAHNYEVEKSKRELRQYLVTLNEQMQGREYIGDAYSLGDITYIPFFFRLERYQAIIDNTLPNLNAWMRRLLDRPVVRATP